MLKRARKAALAALRGRRVAVFGDAMLDGFVWGDATRISPEAPVPVVLVERLSWALGGAANVAANIAALGGQPILFCALGTDAAARRVRQLAAAAAIEIAGVVLAGRLTPVKYRVVARNKHLLRIDREGVTPIPDHAAAQLVAALAARSDVEAVVVSDYAKGGVTAAVLRRLARLCAARRIPWCVDPKQANLNYRSATVIKPNRLELEVLSGMPGATAEQLRQAAARVLRRYRCNHLLVTRGAEGMALFGADGSERFIDGTGHAVADVTGAGDTVSAVLGLGLAAGFALPHIAELANQAGAYVVSRPGTTVVRAEHLV